MSIFHTMSFYRKCIYLCRRLHCVVENSVSVFFTYQKKLFLQVNFASFLMGCGGSTPHTATEATRPMRCRDPRAEVTGGDAVEPRSVCCGDVVTTTSVRRPGRQRRQPYAKGISFVSIVSSGIDLLPPKDRTANEEPNAPLQRANTMPMVTAASRSRGARRLQCAVLALQCDAVCQLPEIYVEPSSPAGGHRCDVQPDWTRLRPCC